MSLDYIYSLSVRLLNQDFGRRMVVRPPPKHENDAPSDHNAEFIKISAFPDNHAGKTVAPSGSDVYDGEIIHI